MMDYLQPCCIGTGKASSWSCKVQRLHPLSHSQSDTRSFHRLQHRVTQKCIDNNQGSRSDADSKPLEVFLVKENDKGELLPSDERSENGRWVEKYLLYGFWVTSCMMAGTRKALADEWYPRRHQQKRLQMKSTLEKWILQNDMSREMKRESERRKALLEQQMAQSKLKQDDSPKDVIHESIESIKSLIKNQGSSKSEKARYSVGISRRPPPAAYYGHSIRPREEPLAVGSLILWALLGGSVLIYLKNKFGWSLGSGHGRNQKRGKWVRDRSLGGKMVFIEDAPPQARPLWDDLPSEDLDDQKSLAAYGSDFKKDVHQDKIVPLWWAPPAAVKYVSSSRKDELTSTARGILRQLENEKISLGQDYSLSLLVSLRSCCHNAGGISVTPSTQSGRDSMLRSAIKYSLSNPKSMLGGYEPSRFISGLAQDLGIPEDRAIVIVHSEIAAQCRGALIDAEAAFRVDNGGLVSQSLSKIVYALQSFPIPAGTPEMELVGRSVMQHNSLEFRKAVFFAAGSHDLSIAPIVAEMVGFNADLVMPQLLLQAKQGQSD